MSTIAGWLVIFLTALFAIWLADYKAGILVLIMFAVSPTFIGHTQNNLKDIPFALAYIASTYFTLRFLVSGRKNSYRVLIFLTLSIAFSISIRAGGLLSICYLFFFYFIFYLFKYLRERKIDLVEIRTKFLLICVITLISWFLSILLWPYALQGPVKNVIESYHIMAHFPSTFRQIFNGRVGWSDYMPWYYLPKSILITIPITVLTGLILFSIFIRLKLDPEKTILYGLVIFSVIFPIVFVVFEKSNIYSSWRQFLFVYPGLVLLASSGYHHFYENLKSRYLRWGMVVLLAILSIHPFKFMLTNPPY
jgi:4-amino-4-deoxy-L-arabinose transferase-like glycosyltransferase